MSHRAQVNALALRWVIAAVVGLSTRLDAQSGMLTTTGNQAAVSVPDSAALVPVNGYTIEAWFYFDPSAPGGVVSPTIIRKNASTPAYLLRTSSALGGSLEFYANNGSYCVPNAGPTPIASWHHLAGTHDGAVARLFLDGVQVSQSACSGPPTFMPGTVDIAKGAQSNESWHGSIDEVRIWSVARTAAQIQADMFFERDNVPTLVAAWHFNGNYFDLTGNHHGVPNGQVAIQPSTSPVLADEIQSPVLSPIGAPLVLTVKSSVPNVPYIVDVSVTGNSPGIFIPAPINKTLPLNPPLLHLTFGSYFDSLFDDFFGFTGLNNTATVTLDVPYLPSIIGSSVWGSYVLLDPSYPLGIRHVGNGTVTTLTGPSPVVTSVTPSTSPTSGGVAVVVHGANFLAGASVTIGTSMATSVNVIDGSTLTCVTPPQSLGPKVVKVTNPDTTFGMLSNAITYVPNLVITAITPLVAVPGSTTTISGSGFATGVTIAIGGSSVATTSVSPGSVTFITPPGVSCDASVVVTNPDGQVQGAIWNRSPVIASTIGATGPAAGGASFFILGADFYNPSGVTIAGTPASILFQSSTTLQVQAPPGAPGVASVVLTSPNGCTATTSYLYQ